jgi:hypothetical protein
MPKLQDTLLPLSEDPPRSCLARVNQSTFGVMASCPKAEAQDYLDGPYCRLAVLGGQQLPHRSRRDCRAEKESLHLDATKVA